MQEHKWELNEKRYYFTILLYGLFTVISLRKAACDKLENIKVTGIYYGLCWCVILSSIVLLVIGLWNAMILPSEKGFYTFAFLLQLFGAIAVQKNARDNMMEESFNTHIKIPTSQYLIGFAF